MTTKGPSAAPKTPTSTNLAAIYENGPEPGGATAVEKGASRKRPPRSPRGIGAPQMKAMQDDAAL
jgi:hypothetical protein